MAVTGKGDFPQHGGFLKGKGKGKGTTAFIKGRITDTKQLMINDWFFNAVGGVTYYGILKRWTGSVWVKEPLKVFSGSWVTKPLKRWNGTEWVQVDATGV